MAEEWIEANLSEPIGVEDVATALGFFELGRFSQRYRQRFGEPPSMTLAKRPEPPPFTALTDGLQAGLAR